MPINDFAQITTGIAYFYNQDLFSSPTEIIIGLDKNDYDFGTKREYPAFERAFVLDALGNFADSTQTEAGVLALWKNGRGATGSQYYIIYPDGVGKGEEGRVYFVIPADDAVNNYTTVDLRAMAIPANVPVDTITARFAALAMRYDVPQNLTGIERERARTNIAAAAAADVATWQSELNALNAAKANLSGATFAGQVGLRRKFEIAPASKTYTQAESNTFVYNNEPGRTYTLPDMLSGSEFIFYSYAATTSIVGSGYGFITPNGFSLTITVGSLASVTLTSNGGYWCVTGSSGTVTY